MEQERSAKDHAETVCREMEEGQKQLENMVPARMCITLNIMHVKMCVAPTHAQFHNGSHFCGWGCGWL